MPYFIFDQDTQRADIPVLGHLPAGVDELDVIGGKSLAYPNLPLTATLAPWRGDLFLPDAITYLIPLVSDKVKAVFESAGIDNVQYFPVQLLHPSSGAVVASYWLTIVLGLLDAIDRDRSTGKLHKVLKIYRWRSIVIDDSRARGLDLFRVVDKRQLMIISERLKVQLEAAALSGVRIRATQDYDGS